MLDVLETTRLIDLTKPELDEHQHLEHYIQNVGNPNVLQEEHQSMEQASQDVCDHSVLQERVQELESEINQLQNEFLLLRVEYESSTEKKDAVIHDLNDQISKQFLRIKELEETNSLIRDKLKCAEQADLSEKRRVQYLRTELDKTRAAIASLKGDYEKSCLRKDDIIQDLERRLSLKDSKISELESTQSLLRDKLKESEIDAIYEQDLSLLVIIRCFHTALRTLKF